ncbi:uncharacterized protein LOC144271650 [Eretmochelys imbricata]
MLARKDTRTKATLSVQSASWSPHWKRRFKVWRNRYRPCIAQEKLKISWTDVRICFYGHNVLKIQSRLRSGDRRMVKKFGSMWPPEEERGASMYQQCRYRRADEMTTVGPSGLASMNLNPVVRPSPPSSPLPTTACTQRHFLQSKDACKCSFAHGSQYSRRTGLQWSGASDTGL